MSIDKNAANEIIRDSYGWTALHHATIQNKPGEARDLIRQNPNIIHIKDGSGRTALHYAARDNRDQIVDILLAAGADVNVESKIGWTPLHYAANEGHAAATAKLILAGAQIKVNIEGQTPLHCACDNYWNIGPQALIERAQVLLLLIARGANINAPDKASPQNFPLSLIPLELSDTLLQIDNFVKKMQLCWKIWVLVTELNIEFNNVLQWPPEELLADIFPFILLPQLPVELTNLAFQYPQLFMLPERFSPQTKDIADLFPEFSPPPSLLGISHLLFHQPVLNSKERRKEKQIFNEVKAELLPRSFTL